MSKTDFAALDALYPAPAELLSRQWVLTEDAAAAPEAWERRRLGGWILAAHPDAHVCALTDLAGRPIGWILEPLVRLSGEAAEVLPERLSLPIGEGDGPRAVEAALYGRDAAGRSNGEGVEGAWTTILLGPEGRGPMRRVYLGALSSAVYAADRRTIAATVNLIPDLVRDLEVSRAFDTLATRAPVTFGLTPFRDVRRLLQNHCLDLDRFEVLRHWPADGLEPDPDPREGVARFVDGSRRLTTALATGFHTFVVPLSAGRDSRAVLSLLRDVVSSGAVGVRLFTSRGADLVSRTDAQAAARLAAIAELPHEIRPRRPSRPTEAEALLNFVRIGEAATGGNVANALKQSAPATGTLALPGMGGETARTYFWPRGRPPALAPGALARRIQSPPAPAVVEAAALWLEGLPEPLRRRPADVLDLAYVEQRLGSGEAPQRYLRPGATRKTLNLFGTTLAFDVMLRLPEPYRRSGRFQEDVIDAAWPKLLEVPFNSVTGWGRIEAARDGIHDLVRRALIRGRAEFRALTSR